MPQESFVHLHVHTHYSLLDGACRVSDLAKRAKQLGMPSIAITDHGCMFGVIEFFNECKKEGVKPILGMEAYMAPGDRRDRSTPGGTAGEAAFHLLLLAQNLEGYRNLLKLSTTAYREGFYYKPRIDKEILREHSKGIIATSACLGGEIPSAFLKRDKAAAKKVAETYLEIFGPDRFFIEVQKHVPEQDIVNPELVDLGNRLGCGIVATNDVHFLNKDDHFAHDVLCCISMGRLISDDNRLKYPTELYLKSPEEMRQVLGQYDGAIDNTLRIAQMCNLELDFSKKYAPVYRVPREKLWGEGTKARRDGGTEGMEGATERESDGATKGVGGDAGTRGHGDAERKSSEHSANGNGAIVGSALADAAAITHEEQSDADARGRKDAENSSLPASPRPHVSASPFISAPSAPQSSVLGSTELAEVSPQSSPPDDELYLRQLCEEGLVWRYGTTDVSPDIRQRLDYELSVIARKNFCSYFLIVWDFCNFARDNGIPVGARGSGVGTMVGYLLGLCNVDPIQYNLLFERFMDPSRNEMPDIDIDICQEGRQRVIEYVRNKYGHVAQIITFGTLAARAVCKDVGRVMGVPLPVTDKLTKLIPGTPGMTLDKALNHSPELADLYRNDAQIKQIIDIGKRLEGLCRNAGMHAAGVIIADQPLENMVPLYKDSDDNILTQFEGPIAEKCGLLKMDFLGLRTLTTLTRAIELEKSTRDIRPIKWSPNQPPPPLDDQDRIDIEKIDLTDKNVLALFCRGESKGIFQFESGGMQDLLMKMQPDRIEDLIAANALYRPGPMELIPLYCNRKHGKEAVPKVHPIMDKILEETYSIMVYQEQVMQIFNQLGGIELSNAYKLIKAISKKTADVIAKFKPDFIKGTMEKGVSKEKAEEIFELILKFGGYGFNKSHSTRYAIVAFQTAYMKTYHPVEYMAAVLTFEMGSTDKVVEYIEECRRLTMPDGSRGIKVLPPDVNVSDKDFTPLYVVPEAKGKKRKAAPKAEGVIRFGMMAVRGVGEKAVEAIIAERKERGPYASLFDFTERVEMRQVTRATMEALIKCGAFSSLGARRSQLLQALDRAVEMGQQLQQDKRSGQTQLFGGGPAAGAPRMVADALPDVDELPDADLLKFEKELLGFYITSHPLTEHQSAIEHYSTASTKDVLSISEGTEVTIGGMINRVKKSVTKNGRSAGMTMAMITVEDLEGQIDAVLFGETLAEVQKRYPDCVSPERIVFMRGKVDRRRETPNIIVNEMIPVEESIGRLTTAIALKLDPLRHNAETIAELERTLAAHKGNAEVYIQVDNGATRRVMMRLDRERFLKPSPQLLDDLELILGPGSVQLCGAGTRRRKKIAQQQALFKEAEQADESSLAAAPESMPLAEAEMELAED